MLLLRSLRFLALPALSSLTAMSDGSGSRGDGPAERVEGDGRAERVDNNQDTAATSEGAISHTEKI